MGKQSYKHTSRIQKTPRTHHNEPPGKPPNDSRDHNGYLLEEIITLDYNANGSSDSISAVPPMSLPLWRKIVASISLYLIAFVLGFDSSIGSALVGTIIKRFHVLPPFALMNVAMYVKGWSLGTALFGPLSDVFGRRYPMIIGTLLFVVFQIPTGEAKNLQTLIICRFLTGFFGSVPLILAHSIFADIWLGTQRNVASAIFTACLLTGACLGPIAGTYLLMARIPDIVMGWRWIEYTTVIMSAAVWPTVFFIPESRAMRTVQTRPRGERRRSISHHGLGGPHEINPNRVSAKHLFDVWIHRPFIMIFTEPVLLLNTVHSALAFGILYISFETYMQPFVHTRHWKPDLATLPPFITMAIGILIGTLITLYFITVFFSPQLRQNGGNLLRPEQRLIPVAIGAFLLPGGLFWFAWTDKRDVHWLAQSASCLLIGAGVMLICQQSEAYTLEIYRNSKYLNSALTATLILRTMFAGGFTMAGSLQYERMHVPWATTIWGIAATVMIAIPICLYIFGERMRARSRYARGSLVDSDVDVVSQWESRVPAATSKV